MEEERQIQANQEEVQILQSENNFFEFNDDQPKKKRSSTYDQSMSDFTQQNELMAVTDIKTKSENAVQQSSDSQDLNVDQNVNQVFSDSVQTQQISTQEQQEVKLMSENPKKLEQTTASSKSNQERTPIAQVDYVDEGADLNFDHLEEYNQFDDKSSKNSDNFQNCLIEQHIEDQFESGSKALEVQRLSTPPVKIADLNQITEHQNPLIEKQETKEMFNLLSSNDSQNTRDNSQFVLLQSADQIVQPSNQHLSIPPPPSTKKWGMKSVMSPRTQKSQLLQQSNIQTTGQTPLASKELQSQQYVLTADLNEKLKSNFFNVRYKISTETPNKQIFSGLFKFIKTDKVEITKSDHLPVVIFGQFFKKPTDNTVSQSLEKSKAEYKAFKESIKKQVDAQKIKFDKKFFSAIWCCYRKNFNPLLSKDEERMQQMLCYSHINANEKVNNTPQSQKTIRIGLTNDVGWGCTVRVAQMMLSHSILSWKHGNYQISDLVGSPTYRKLLGLINDNFDSFDGAYGIQNVARMSAVFNKFPGEWHGNKSISVVMNYLNKVYQPFEGFQMCVFGDETVYYDKIKKKAHLLPRSWLQESINKVRSGKVKKNERAELIMKIEIMFKHFFPDLVLQSAMDQVTQQDNKPIETEKNKVEQAQQQSDLESVDLEQFETDDFFDNTRVNGMTGMDKDEQQGNSPSQTQTENNQTQTISPDEIDASKVSKEWKNAVLTIVCARLGMKQISRDYHDVFQYIFRFSLCVGILGGRPQEAYYLIGFQTSRNINTEHTAQNGRPDLDQLIFLDPHHTQKSIPADIQKISQHHMDYHEKTAKKISIKDLDPSLGFGFLIRSQKDFDRFTKFMAEGKRVFKGNWPFHCMESKPDWMNNEDDDYCERIEKIPANQQNHESDDDDFQTYEESKKSTKEFAKKQEQMVDDDDFELL